MRLLVLEWMDGWMWTAAQLDLDSMESLLKILKTISAI